jgi:hypothetical protein
MKEEFEEGNRKKIALLIDGNNASSILFFPDGAKGVAEKSYFDSEGMRHA